MYSGVTSIPNWQALLELLRLADDVIRELLYVEEFARRQLFFRRVRIPTLLQVYWHNIFVNHSVRKVLGYFVQDKEACLRAAALSLQKLDRMQQLAADSAMPVADTPRKIENSTTAMVEVLRAPVMSRKGLSGMKDSRVFGSESCWAAATLPSR